MASQIRLAFRGLFRSPGFAVTAILTLALGIGANSAVFTVFDAVVLRPLPFPEPDRIVKIRGHNDLRGWNGGLVAMPDIGDFRTQSTKFAAVAGYTGGVWILTGRGPAAALRGSGVSLDFFSVLGIGPRLGRSFVAEEYEAGRDSAVILSDHAWRRNFNGDPRVLDTVVALDGEPHQIVGIMGPEFQFPETADIWLPLGADRPVSRSRDFSTVNAIARLKPGVGIGEAQSEIAAIGSRIAEASPKTHSGFSADITTLADDQFGSTGAVIDLFLGAVACVLLIACSNVANLMLARATGRSRELAIRAALGATAAQLLSQTLAESLVLSLSGAALGLILAYGALRALVISNAGLVPRVEGIHLNPLVVAFTIAVALLTSVLFSAFPAVSILRTDPQKSLGDRSAGASAAANRARAGLVITQFALAAMLACSAGLLLKTLNRLISTDPGFRTQRILTADVTLTDRSYQTGMRKTYLFYRDALRAIGEIPGVERAGLANTAPLGSGVEFHVMVSRPGALVKEPAALVAASPGYHQTMGIPLETGREFEWDESATVKRVRVILSQSLAKGLFQSQNPIGQSVLLSPNSSELEVVGVVGDVRTGSLEDPPESIVYMPLERSWMRFSTFAIRSSLPPEQLVEPVRKAVERIDPNVPLQNVRTMEEAASHSLASPRFRTMLLTAFAGAALMLAVIGIYGLLTYTVEQRYREIGVRMALGATSWVVGRMIAAEGLRLAAIGVAIGVGSAFALGRAIGGLVYGIEPLDPEVAVTAATLFLSVAAAAAVAPAIRAARADPQEVLRHD